MATREPLDQRVRALLKNLELKIVLDSPDQKYRFEYYTTTSKDEDTGELDRKRTYRLLDLGGGRVIPEPWDSYDFEKQTTLVTNLIEFARYKISRIVTGWSIKCPSCGHIVRGKHWETAPKSCPASGTRKCQQRLDSSGIIEETLED
jgi:hypothetical protein